MIEKKSMQVLEGEDARNYLKKKRKQALIEFKEWKKGLCEIINKQSKLVFNKNGTYQFIIASKMVKLVWATTIKERIKIKMMGGLDLDQARKAAMDEIRDEVSQAHEEMTSPPKEIVKYSNEEEEKAKQALIEMRKKLVKDEL
jgi:hypothetical protein